VQERETGQVSAQEYEALKSRVQELESALAACRRGEGVAGAARALQQSVIDSLVEPVMVIGTDYRVKVMNRAAREFVSEDAGRPGSPLCYQISHRREVPCDGLEHPCPLQEVRDSGQAVTVVHQHYRRNGEPRFAELIASPLWAADGSLEGIIECMRDVTERVRDAEALQRYADRLRALTARLSEVTEDERQRLACELHDQVGQNLTALGINLSIVRTQIPAEMAPRVSSRLEDSLALVEETAERIRDLMADLRPPVLDDYGLLAALRWHGEQFARRTDITVDVIGEEPAPRLPAHVEEALFRIAQEALTNVAKHSGAEHATVKVDMDSQTLRLVVTDHGIGFESAQLDASMVSQGWGLLSMTERAEAVGGRCQIKSGPGQGTRVIVEVPR
jgi:signal transduction histidine kinase